MHGLDHRCPSLMSFFSPASIRFHPLSSKMMLMERHRQGSRTPRKHDAICATESPSCYSYRSHLATSDHPRALSRSRRRVLDEVRSTRRSHIVDSIFDVRQGCPWFDIHASSVPHVPSGLVLELAGWKEYPGTKSSTSRCNFSQPRRSSLPRHPRIGGTNRDDVKTCLPVFT